MSLEHIVERHTSKKQKAVHYSRKTTYGLALLCLVFFGTILAYSAFSETIERITGMVTVDTVQQTQLQSQAQENSITGFVTAVKTSPQVTEIKLFFYTAWTLVVLIGSAVWYEIEERKR